MFLKSPFLISFWLQVDFVPFCNSLSLLFILYYYESQTLYLSYQYVFNLIESYSYQFNLSQRVTKGRSSFNL